MQETTGAFRSLFATAAEPSRILVENFFGVPTVPRLTYRLMEKKKQEKTLFLNVKQFQFLNSRVGVLETVFEQNPKIQPQISLSRLANVW